MSSVPVHQRSAVLEPTPASVQDAGWGRHLLVLLKSPRLHLWLIALLVAACMIRPVLVMATAGITLTGMAEESIGYRYFYTLRFLYADHERPWLPQGQLTGLSHIVLQVLLTGAGYPPEQLFPRIDVFAYLASALPSLLTAGAFVYAVSPLRDARLQLIVGLLLLLVVFDSRNGRGLHLIQADYLTWVHPVALITVGMMLRAVNHRWSLTPRRGLSIGLFAAVALTIKLTYVMFVIPVAVLLFFEAVSHRRWRDAARGGVVAMVTAALGVVLITWAYYLGDVRATYGYFVGLVAFVDAVGTVTSFGDWLPVALYFPPQPISPLALGVLLVPVLAASMLFLPNRLVSFALLSGALISVYISWRRFYPITLIETNCYTFVILVVWTACVLLPLWGASVHRALWAWSEKARLPVSPISAIAVVVVVTLSVHLAQVMSDAQATMLGSFGVSSRGSKELTAHLQQLPGRVAFLIPDGNRRPTTVDTAIGKGGTDISDTTWGVSPYIRSLFPERDYYFGIGAGGPRVNMSAYDRVVFVSVPSFGGDADAQQKLWDHFGVSLAGMDCGYRVDLQHHEVVVCERVFRSLAFTPTQTAYYYAGDAVPAVGQSAASASGQPRTLAVGDLVYWRGQGLWQVDAESGAVAVRSTDGARVTVEGIGAWNPINGALSGLPAVYGGGRWSIDTEQLTAANTNPTLQGVGSAGEPIAGWQLAPGDAPPTVERRTDDAGPYVRLHPNRQGSSVVLYASAPLSQLDGAPVVLRATVRAHGATPATVTVFDVVTAPDQAQTRSVSTSSFDVWETLEVRLDRVSFPYPGDNFSVALFGAEAGNWLDVREVSLLVGVAP